MKNPIIKRLKKKLKTKKTLIEIMRSQFNLKKR